MKLTSTLTILAISAAVFGCGKSMNIQVDGSKTGTQKVENKDVDTTKESKKLECLNLTGKYKFKNLDDEEVTAELVQTGCEKYDITESEDDIHAVYPLDGQFHKVEDVLVAASATATTVEFSAIEGDEVPKDKMPLIRWKVVNTQDAATGDVLSHVVHFDESGKVISDETRRLVKIK